jgi:hypothetical protein
MSVLFSYQQVQCIQKGSRLQAAEIENVAVWATRTCQVYGEEALVHSTMFKWHKHIAKGRHSLEGTEGSILVDQEWWELNPRSKKFQRWFVPTIPKW